MFKKSMLLLSCMSLLMLIACNEENEYPPTDETETDYVLDVPTTEDSDEFEYWVEITSDDELEDATDETEIVIEDWPERVVFLTIDDGPGEYTAMLLDVLYEEGVPAIFFLWGDRILDDVSYSQALMERMLEEGHYIGLHTMTHSYHTLYVGSEAPSRFVNEMFELQELIYELVGHQTYLCRAAYGMMTGFRREHFVAVDDAGLTCIDWNIDPQDWRSYRDAQLIYEHVVQQVERLNFPSEVVIVLHEFDRTAAALPAIISFLHEHGYTFKTYEPGHEFTYDQYPL